MAINWDSIGSVRSPAPEIASITGLLSAFAENREKQRMAAEARAMQEREFALRQQNIDADNARAAQELQLRRDQQEQAAAAAKAKAEQERDEKVRGALPGIRDALSAGEEGKAHMLAGPLGIGIGQTEAGKAAPVAQAGRGEEFDAALSPLSAFGLVPDMARGVGKMAAAAPTEEEARAERSRELRLPAGKVLEVDPQEERQAKETRASADATRVSGALGPEMGAAYAERLIKAGMSPEDAAKMAVGRVQHLEDQDRMDARARSRPRGPTEHQTDTSERGWHSQAENSIQRYYTSQGYSDAVKSFRGYKEMLSDLKSGNTAQMMGGLGAWVKEKSGGSSVVTENEIKRYAESAIPWTATAEKAFNYWVKGGKLPPAYVKPFTSALEKSVISRQRGIVEQIGLGAQASLMADPSPEIRAMAPSAYTRAVTPLMSAAELKEFIEKQGGRGTGGAPAQQKSGGPVDLKSLDAEADKLLGGGK
jgi:hypothetical protein